MKKLAIRMATAVQSRQRLDNDGAVSAEYGVLLAGVVAVVAIAAVALGGRISDIFRTILP
jgi:Flp pilus assembly pilin Flp